MMSGQRRVSILYKNHWERKCGRIVKNENGGSSKQAGTKKLINNLRKVVVLGRDYLAQSVIF